MSERPSLKVWDNPKGFLPADRYSSVTEEAIKILDNFNMSDKKSLTPKGLSEGI